MTKIILTRSTACQHFLKALLKKDNLLENIENSIKIKSYLQNYSHLFFF